MNIAYLIGKNSESRTGKMKDLVGKLVSSGFSMCEVSADDELGSDVEMLLSLGGDGTFLKAARIAASAGVPVMGVNFGRLGFLSEFRCDDVPGILRNSDFRIEERTLLSVSINGNDVSRDIPYVLNEVVVRRCSGGILGIDADVGDCPLPTYWADGLLVSTSAGSTAYSLSAGGPICMPDVDAVMIVPVAPHNINTRPLVLPAFSSVTLRLHDPDGRAVLEIDNHSVNMDGGMTVSVSRSPVKLKVLSRGGRAFIRALQDKLFWGEDKRNTISCINDNE